MPFELISPDLNNLVKRRLLTDVSVRRHLYRHSWARVVIDWDELLLEGDKSSNGARPTTQLAAAMLNTDVKLLWRANDMSAQVDCFHGYVTNLSARHTATRSFVVLDCVSYSKRTDLVPRYRVFQACTLLDICQHIASKDSLFEISSQAQSVLSGNTIDLSVQYGETDFAYLSRMMHAWGIPLGVDDRAGKVIIGSPQVQSNGAFPEFNFHWGAVGLDGALVPLDKKARTEGGGSPGIARQYVSKFNKELNWLTNEYVPKLDADHEEERKEIADRVHETVFRGDPVTYRAQIEGAVLDFSPGCPVNFAGQSALVRSVHIKGHPYEDTVSQEFVLQDYMAPLQPHRRKVRWASRTLWAHVTKNNQEDPQQRGRIQVEFDWEQLDPTGDANRKCWLPTLTPYGGLKGKSGTSGFLSLPEVGEHVLVEFLGDWDSDAVVIGSVREYVREGFKYDPHETKRWQTPSGNQVTLTTRNNGDTDIVRVKCKDKMVFEATIKSGKEIVIMDLCDSDDDRIHFQKGGGPTQLDVFCSANVYIHAEQKLYIEGGEVQITSKTGNVNIKSAANVEVAATTVDVDGSAGVNIDGGMVKLNSPPAVPHTHWSLQPLKKEPDEVEEGPTETVRKRAKPPAWGEASDTSATREGEQQAYKIRVKLLSDIDKSPLARVNYEVLDPRGNVMATGVTDDEGIAEHPVPEPGNYKVRPIAPPADYILSAVLLDATGEQPLKDQPYELTGRQGKYVGVTDSEGKLQHENVPPGEYELKLSNYPSVRDRIPAQRAGSEPYRFAVRGVYLPRDQQLR